MFEEEKKNQVTLELFDLELSVEEMEQLDQLDRNVRTFQFDFLVGYGLNNAPLLSVFLLFLREHSNGILSSMFTSVWKITLNSLSSFLF